MTYGWRSAPVESPSSRSITDSAKSRAWVVMVLADHWEAGIISAICATMPRALSLEFTPQTTER